MMAPVSVRTITASCDVQSPEDPALEQALEFLRQARARFQEAGYRVQTSRIAARLPGARPDDDWHRRVVAIDRLVAAAGVLWATGPEPAAADPGRFPAWCARVVADTAATFLSVDVGGTDRGVDPRACEAAARTIATLARSTEGGEGNFRFAGAAGCPPGLPFFPAARHEGLPGFALGLESAGLVDETYRRHGGSPLEGLRRAIDDALAPLERICAALASRHQRRWIGIDVSPAPGLDASIGGALERLIGQPFGSLGTLHACALTTTALHTTAVRRCGYSGLMLPVLEDRVLAARAAEERYRLQDLLLWSSVCGTGFDVVPLPGDIPDDDLTRCITDVAALSARLRKPLSARLLPVPGAKAGDMSRFTNPLLVNTRVFEV
jgi:uncharacterized protein (UPF0210 family)